LEANDGDDPDKGWSTALLYISFCCLPPLFVRCILLFKESSSKPDDLPDETAPVVELGLEGGSRTKNTHFNRFPFPRINLSIRLLRHGPPCEQVSILHCVLEQYSTGFVMLADEKSKLLKVESSKAGQPSASE